MKGKKPNSENPTFQVVFLECVPQWSAACDVTSVSLRVCVWQGQGAITEKLRSLSMHDLTQISQQDERGGSALYPYSAHAGNPAAVRRSHSTDAADDPGKHTHTHTHRCVQDASGGISMRQCSILFSDTNSCEVRRS